MTPHWQPNDKALCVRTQPWLLNDIEVTETSAVPVYGQTYHVIDVTYMGGGALGLALVGFDAWWDSVEFIRVEPASIREAREATQTKTSHDSSSPSS